MIPALGHAPRLVLLTWCDPWLVAMPIASVRRIASPEDLFTPQRQEVTLDLAELLGFAPQRARIPGEPGAWVVVDRQTPTALRVDRCLQVIDPGSSITPVPRSFLRTPAALGCFPVRQHVAGLDVQPEFGLWLDPALLSLTATPHPTP